MITSITPRETFTITLEDVALMTSFCKYVEANEKEPQKVESIGRLKNNLHTLYTKMKTRELKHCLVTVGKANKDKIDYTPYRITKSLSKSQAACVALNQASKERNQEVDIVFTSETDEYYEFVIKGVLNGYD